MSQPSPDALRGPDIAVTTDRRGRLRARWLHTGRSAPVPTEVRELVTAGHPLDVLWSRLECFGGGVRACPWLLSGEEPPR